MFPTFWDPSSCSLFWYIGGKPDGNFFSSLNGLNKSSTSWANFSLELFISFGTWYGTNCLTFQQCIISICSHLVFQYNTQYKNSWKYLAYGLVACSIFSYTNEQTLSTERFLLTTDTTGKIFYRFSSCKIW